MPLRVFGGLPSSYIGTASRVFGAGPVGPMMPAEGFRNWFADYISDPQAQDQIQDGLYDFGQRAIDFGKSAYDSLSSVWDFISDKADAAWDSLDPALKQVQDFLLNIGPSSSAASGVASSTFSPETIDYLNAELARAYGMDRNSAYQEALANTAYQRAVKDMQKAGLNPAAIFGNGRGSTASGVGYVGSASSASGYSKSEEKLFSSESYGAIASIAGLVAAVVTKKPSNYFIGEQSAKSVMQVLNALEGSFK